MRLLYHQSRGSDTRSLYHSLYESGAAAARAASCPGFVVSSTGRRLRAECRATAMQGRLMGAGSTCFYNLQGTWLNLHFFKLTTTHAQLYCKDCGVPVGICGRQCERWRGRAAVVEFCAGKLAKGAECGECPYSPSHRHALRTYCISVLVVNWRKAHRGHKHQ